jgi:hypothetical protein
MKWIQTLCSCVTLAVLIYLAERCLHEGNAPLWVVVVSVVVMLTYLWAVQTYRSRFTSFSSLLYLLGPLAFGAAVRFAGDCALGFFRAPSHALWGECIYDSEPAFDLTAGSGSLSLGVIVLGCLQLAFAWLIKRISALHDGSALTMT